MAWFSFFRDGVAGGGFDFVGRSRCGFFRWPAASCGSPSAAGTRAFLFLFCKRGSTSRRWSSRCWLSGPLRSNVSDRIGYGADSGDTGGIEQCSASSELCGSFSEEYKPAQCLEETAGSGSFGSRPFCERRRSFPQI